MKFDLLKSFKKFIIWSWGALKSSEVYSLSNLFKYSDHFKLFINLKKSILRYMKSISSGS